MRIIESLVSLALLGSFVVAEPVASSDFDDGPQGWTLNASARWESTGGNPGGRIFGPVPEKTNTSAAMNAPAAFLGNWAPYDTVGSVSFDFIRISNGAQPQAFGPPSVRITGPGGQARWEGPALTAPGPWMTYTAPLIESEWTVLSGTWEAILADVTEVFIPIELVTNGNNPDEQAAVDNVILDSGAAPCVGDIDGDGMIGFADLNAILSAFNTAPGDAGYNAAADLDDDDFVGFGDLNIVLGSFNTACP